MENWVYSERPGNLEDVSNQVNLLELVVQFVLDHQFQGGLPGLEVFGSELYPLAYH